MRNNRMHTMHRSVYSDTSGYKNHPLAELSQCILDSSNGSIINVI